MRLNVTGMLLIHIVTTILKSKVLGNDSDAAPAGEYGVSEPDSMR
jgi:hypothetical protein